jgi:hypothetical protein
MKTLVYFFAVIMSASVLFSGCEEIEKGLLDDLAEGKMVVVFDNGEEEFLDCSYGQYGETTEGFKGEVFINGFMTASTEKYFSIMYGSYTNATGLTTKAYSTANEEDMIMVNSSYGQIGEDGASVTILFVSVQEDGIKGTFTGKLSTESGLKNVTGAFWAVKQQEHVH